MPPTPTTPKLGRKSSVISNAMPNPINARPL